MIREILILDEPTSGLIQTKFLGVRDLIRELAKTKTILLSTHILQEVEAMADSVLLLATDVWFWDAGRAGRRSMG